MQVKKVLLLSLIMLSSFSFSAEERVSLNSLENIPSFDLIYNGEELSAEEAWSLKKQGTDLSRLEPAANDIWSRKITPSDNQSINVNSGDTLDFSATITSYSGLLRFNVKKKEGLGKFFTVLLDKKIHTLLLRKNYLEKLGYKIPPVKYLKKLKINFPDKKTRNFFFKRSLPEGTLGAPSRWIQKDFKESDEQLVYEFQDIAVMEPSEQDTFNVSLGVPTNRRLTSRTMRALVLPYSILNLGESVNKFAWHEGSIQNQNLVLPHFFNAQFGTSYDDLLWMGRIISGLSRADIEDAVKKSFFPPAVEKILIEKISSRQNYLLNTLNISSRPLYVDNKASFGASLIQGKLKNEKWAGYAANFTHGDRKSPLDDIHYFIFSKLQKFGIDNLISEFNGQLKLFDVSKRRAEFQLDQFNEGLNEFIQTGRFIEFGVGTWVSPVANGIGIVSRDIIVGNYEGTNNLVQLADTIGYGFEVGAHMGIENLGDWFPVSARGTLSYVRTYSHLKPVQSLKLSFKEPYRNILVPMIKNNITETLNLVEQQADDVENFTEKKNKELKKIFDQVSRDLEVGESIIITDRVVPQGLLVGETPLGNGFRLSLGLVASHPFIKRLHIFRKSTDTMQIFEDKGKKFDVTFSASVSNYIPLVSFETSKEVGNYNVEVHEVNLNSDLEENPDFFSNIHGITQVFENGSTELLESRKKPFKIEANFVDKAKKGSFLFWKFKKLLKDTFFKVTSPNGSVGKFVAFSTDIVKGVDYENFARDIVNYYTEKIFKDFPFELDVDRFKNPSQTIKGKGKTTKTEFQARIKNNNDTGSWKMEDLRNPFILISRHVEGWKAKQKKIIKIARDLNKRYQQNLFDEAMLRDVKKLSLYDIGVYVQIYEKGFKAINNLTWKMASKERTRMYGRNYCKPNSSVTADFSKTDECKAFSRIRSRISKCDKLKKKSKKAKDIVKCLTKLARDLEDGLDLQGFGNLLGGKNNFYVYSSINGLMSDSEKLNDPIISNSVGKVGDRFFRGPVQGVIEKIGINPGEFYGMWMREVL